MPNVIKQISCKEWSKFQLCLKAGPCVQPAFPGGICYGLFPDDNRPAIASMVWYSYPFFHTGFRSEVLVEMQGLPEKEALSFINRNIRLLARVSTLPEFRGNGYAYELCLGTLPMLGVPIIECLTAHDEVRRLLTRLGFFCLSENRQKTVDYWVKRLEIL